MPNSQTPNYKLNQWSKSDRIQMEDFNADNAKIDAAIKAESDARTALAAQVAGKASQSALNTLADKAAKCGNCQIWTQTYRGTGQCGWNHPTVLRFPKKPVFALIIYNNSFCFLPPENVTYRLDNRNMGQLTWSGSTASLIYDSTDIQVGSASQLNSDQMTYLAVGFLAVDQ